MTKAGFSAALPRLREGAGIEPHQSVQLLIIDFAAQALDIRALAFTFQPPLFGAVRRLGSAARFRRVRYVINDPLQARQRIGAVHFLRAVLLGFEHDDAFKRDAAVAQVQKARLDFIGQ